MCLLADWTSHGMFLAGIILLLLILLRRSPRRDSSRGRNTSDSAPRRPLAAGSHRALPEPPDDVLQWQVEMHELGRTLKAELDTKMRLLHLLIGQARVESERLEQLLAGLDPARMAGLESSSPDPGQPISGDIHPQQSAIYALADAGQSAHEIAARLEAPLGEVELLLSLRTTSPATGPRSDS
ncbi:MAG: hypothetical protein ACYC3X_00480 [Pirellulaceae bacterium]